LPPLFWMTTSRYQHLSQMVANETQTHKFSLWQVIIGITELGSQAQRSNSNKGRLHVGSTMVYYSVDSWHAFMYNLIQRARSPSCHKCFILLVNNISVYLRNRSTSTGIPLVALTKTLIWTVIEGLVLVLSPKKVFRFRFRWAEQQHRTKLSTSLFSVSKDDCWIMNDSWWWEGDTI
jgi:hypothetical protein